MNLILDIIDENDLTEKYNENEVSKELINYLIDKTIGYKENVNIIVNNKCQTTLEVEELIATGIKREYSNCLDKYYKKNILEFILLGIGILFLFITNSISNGSIWKEMTLIISWVPIWEVIHMELFEDQRDRKRMKALRNLINCDIEVM